jgi:predicted SprT family Zn-dependent metalloprotease
MTTTDALALARNLLAQHNLDHLPVSLSGTKNALGRCFFRGGRAVKIDLSKHWVQALPYETIRDTILHEIAHAIAGVDAGHGEAWKRVCRRIGANPSRVADLPTDVLKSTVKQISNYRAVCSNPQCSSEVYFQRLTYNWRMNRFRCGRCKSEFLPIDYLK